MGHILVIQVYTILGFLFQTFLILFDFCDCWDIIQLAAFQNVCSDKKCFYISIDTNVK